MPERRAVRLIIRGKVQGVGFRVAARDEALARGLTGWVKNCREHGDVVEVTAVGPSSEVEGLVQWARHGPPLAHVAEVEIHEQLPEGLEGAGTFEIWH